MRLTDAFNMESPCRHGRVTGQPITPGHVYEKGNQCVSQCLVIALRNDRPRDR
jgi:hypothetical protein